MLKGVFSGIQKLGFSLMLPVSVLPVAGILLGVGAQKDLGFIPTIVLDLMEVSGNAVFATLPLLFAIGVCIGFTDNDGVAVLAASVGYFIFLASSGTFAAFLDPEATLDTKMGIETIDTGVLGGILVGLLAANIFNRYYNIKLPDYLGFFSGKRFVPIATGLLAVLLGVVVSVIWPPIGNQIQNFSHWAAYQSPVLAFGLYGFVERLLIPTGIHHVWNAPFFFEVGSFITANGQEVFGETARYLNGDPTAGNMSGGYLFKMFGLPAAAMAIWHSAKPENRKVVGGIMMSAALTSFLTGITEPIEFSFLFIAPLLYFFHAILAGLAYITTILLEIKHGMSFSHGFIDFILLFKLSTRGLWLIPLGLVWAALYYTVFRVSISAFNLKTLGREDKMASPMPQSGGNMSDQDKDLALKLIEAHGGKENIKIYNACITRLRITVKDPKKVNSKAIQDLGAQRVNISDDNIQSIFGTRSELLATAMKKA